MMTATAVAGCLALLFVYLAQIWKAPKSGAADPRNSEPLDITKALVDEARQTIDFGYATCPSLKERLALRAQPNQRLVSAFGVTNSLTTTSPEIHRSFLRLASDVINARVPNASGTDTRWINLYAAASTLLKQDLASAPNTPLPLASCVQRLCLTIVLLDNYHLAPSSLPPSTILLIAQEINTQWLLSKCNPSTPPSSTLTAALLSLPLPSSPAPSEVLSLIMPQYETLWRVVLLTFITAYHIQPSPSISTLTASIPACLGTKSFEESSALHIADEALRLYPSNKSIYRSTADFNGTRSADVQACHRDVSIWGEDALCFRPERFERLTGEQERAYFPYSLGKHKCPAYGGFGNRMIVMLVVVLGREMGVNKGRVRMRGGYGEEKWGGALPTGREDMGGWVFEMRGGC